MRGKEGYLEIGNGVEACKEMLEAELEVPQWWVSTKGKFWKTLEDKFKFSCRDNGE